LRFKQGALEAGSIYGWGGSDEMWNFSRSTFHSEQIELSDSNDFNYYSPVADGLVKALGPGADEIYLSPSSDQDSQLRYHIWDERKPVSPIVAKQKQS
jgi:hypothetical protein